MRMFSTRFPFLMVLLGALATPVWAQAPSSATVDAPEERPAVQAPAARPTICGVPVGAPANLPPADSGPVVYLLAPCFSAQGNVSTVDAQTYLYYIQLRPSQPSQNAWISYDEKAEQTMLDDFKRLWATNFLTDLSIDVTDYVFSNGVVGKLVTYHMEERERVKIVNYEGTKVIDRTKIDEQLRMRGIELRLDKAAHDADRDARRTAELAPLWERFLETAARRDPAAVESDRFMDYRFALEEYRLSLFAQEVKTAMPVSAKRLEASWAALASGG